MAMRFKVNLKQLRENKELTQESLSRDLKVNRVTVSLWENNIRVPRIYYRMELCEYFGLTYNEMFEYEYEQERK